jgi:hypothetical protein
MRNPGSSLGILQVIDISNLCRLTKKNPFKSKAPHLKAGVVSFSFFTQKAIDLGNSTSKIQSQSIFLAEYQRFVQK